MGGNISVVDIWKKNDRTYKGRTASQIYESIGLHLQNDFEFFKQIYSWNIFNLLSPKKNDGMRNFLLSTLKIVELETKTHVYWFETQNMRGFIYINDYSFIVDIYENSNINHQIVFKRASLEDILNILTTVEFTEYTPETSQEKE
jgi:hypothetical protein